MPHGASGKILRVDLTRATISTEQFDDALYRLYPGGKALAGYFLLREFPRGADAFDPANVFLLANGLLAGAPFSTATRFTAAARSPLTNGYGESEAGGFWGPEYERNGLGNVGERCVSLEGVGKTGTTLFPHAPSGRTTWMRSCAFCKALLYKVRLCDSARCRCGWIW